MRMLHVAGLLGLCLLGVALGVENPHLVDFGYFLGRTDIALSLLLIGAFGAGMAGSLLLFALWRMFGGQHGSDSGNG